MKTILGLLVACLLLLSVECGNPDCQRQEYNPRKTDAVDSIMADTRHRSRSRSYSQHKRTTAISLVTPIIALLNSTVIPKLAKSYKDLPEKWDGILGPHNNSTKDLNQEFTSAKGIKSASCQFDCLSSVTDCGRNKTMVPIFPNCSEQFYSYGTEAGLGCFSADGIMGTQAQIVFDVCQRYNKCNVSFMPLNLLQTMRKAKGKNSKGSKLMAQAVAQWGRAAFWASKSGDPKVFQEKTAAAVAAVVEQANQAAADAVAKGKDPKKAVDKIIDTAATQFAQAATSMAAKVAVKNAAYKAYVGAVSAKKQAEEAKRQQKLAYANEYLTRDGTPATYYYKSEKGYVKAKYVLTEREQKVGRDFAKAIADAAEHADKAEKTLEAQKAKVAADILKKKKLHKH